MYVHRYDICVLAFYPQLCPLPPFSFINVNEHSQVYLLLFNVNIQLTKSKRKNNKNKTSKNQCLKVRNLGLNKKK